MATPTKNTVSIISGGTTYYLSGGGSGLIRYSGSGTPWTSESTTPFQLSLNDEAPIWVPSAAPGVVVTSAGGITTWGAEVVAVGYTHVTEQVGLTLRGSNHDNAIALLRLLRQIVTTSQRSYPALLAVKSGTNTSYFKILWGDAQETTRYLTEPAGNMRVVLTIVRTPHALPASLTTALNAVTFTNDGTEQSLGTISGDLLHEGQPINLRMTGGQLTDSTAGQRRIYAAVVADASVGPVSGAVLNTSSTTAARAVEQANIAPQVLAGTHYRLLARITGISTNLEVRYVAMYGVNASGVFGDYATGPWVRSNGTTDQMLDLGPLYVPLAHQEYTTATNQRIAYDIEVRSGDGAAATGTLNRLYVLQAYTFCTLQGTPVATSSSYSYILNELVVYDGATRILSPPVTGLISTSAGELVQSMVPRGDLPRAYSGASLWLNWQRMNTNHSTSNTITVTAQYAQLYRTIRGGG